MLPGQALGYRSPQTRWQVIDTDTVKVIFPAGMTYQANRIANVVHQMARNYPIETTASLRKTPVILQNETSISNGYVGFGPYRSEFYLQPFQNPFQLGGLAWEDLLAIHEYRHVQQLSATSQGLSKLALDLFGQNAYTAMVHLAIPDWYLEGDAVISETALTKQGRGRLASFTRGFRDKLRHGEPWRYGLLRNGSFRTWLPNEYPLGFMICDYARKTWGQPVLDKALQEGAAYKPLFYSFSGALKKETGRTTRDLYADAMASYQAEWSSDQGQRIVIDTVMVNREGWLAPNEYRDYRFPSVDSSGNIYAAITRFDQISGIYRIGPDGDMKHLVGLGTQQEPYFSMGGGKLAWTEIRINPRWLREDKSVIVTYDLEKGKKRQITSRGKYFTPAMDPSGEQIAAVFTDSLGGHSLRILDARSGAVMNILPNPENYFFAYPVWSGDSGGVLTTARDLSGKMTILRVDPESGTFEPVVPWSYYVYGRPVELDGWVFASANFGETDHVLGFSPDEHIPYRLTDGPGFFYSPAYDPTGKSFIVSEFTIYGHRLRRVPADRRNWRTIGMSSGVKDFFAVDDEHDILASAPQDTYPQRKYASWSSPLNFHSLNLTLDDPVYELEILSENLLSTTGLSMGYRYNRNFQSHGPFAELTISTWYPELTLGYTGIFRNTSDRNDRRYNLSQNTFDAGVRLPFHFSPGVFNQVFSASSNVSVGVARFSQGANTSRTRIAYLNHSLLIYNAKRRALQHAISPFAQSIRIGYAHSIDSLSLQQFTVTSDFSFPGISRNDALILQFDFVRESTGNDLQLGENFVFSRGYNASENDWAVRFGVNYHFPLLYPDIGIGGIVFFKRLRAKPFFDYTELSFESNRTALRSAGSEFLFDIRIFNVQDLTFGVRWARLLNSELPSGIRRDNFEFFIPLARL